MVMLEMRSEKPIKEDVPAMDDGGDAAKPLGINCKVPEALVCQCLQ